MKHKSTFRPFAAICCGFTATAFAVTIPPDVALTGGTDANNYTVTAVNAGVNGWGTFTGTFDAASQFLISPSTASGPLTFDGVISGVNGIQVQPTSSNPVIFNGANSFAGALNLNGAWMRIGNDSALGTTAGGTNMVTWNGAASYLDLNGHTVTGETLGNEFVNSQLLNSSATTATWTGAINLWAQTRFSATGAGNLVVSGNLAQGGTVQVDASGGGHVILSGNNTNTGWIVVANSRLLAGSAQAFGTAAAPTAIPSWAASGLVDVNGQNIAGETFQNDLANGVLANLAATTGSWGGSVVGNAQLRFIAGSTGDLNITGAISGTSIQVDSGGGGAVVLSGNNTFTDFLNISAATVRLGSANALGTTAGITRIVNWDAAYTALDVNGQTITGETFENNRVNGQLLNTGGNATWAGNVVANEQTRLTAGAGSLTVSGGISGTHLQVDGGAVILSGNNTYTGNTAIANSRVFIGHANALGTTAGPTYIAGWGAWGAVDLNGFTITGETLIFDQSGNLENSAAGPGTWAGNVTNNAWMNLFPFVGSVTVSGDISGIGGVTLAAAGGATLSGTNTYTGNTAVIDGTLTLTTPYLANASTVTITAPGVLNLNYSGTDTVNALYFGLDQQASGTWGSLSSSATHKTARITGNGILNVTTGPSSSSYDTWAGGPFANPFTNTAPEVDFDNDGLSNLLEFVLGGDPTISQNNVRPTVTASGSNLVVTFTRSDASEAQPVAVKVQVSDNLVTWNPADDIVIDAATNPGPIGGTGASYTVDDTGSIDTIVVTIPKGVATKKFARVVATQ